MAVAQGKTSKARKRKRRAHQHLKKPKLARCMRCQQITWPHRVCSNCGYYGKRKVVEVEEG